MPPLFFPTTGLQLSQAQAQALVYALMKWGGPRLADGSRAGFFLGGWPGGGGRAPGCMLLPPSAVPVTLLPCHPTLHLLGGAVLPCLSKLEKARQDSPWAR